MHKCIRIQLSGQSALYKKPMSIGVWESYPLPPYSTVIGFVHKACGFTNYHPMQVSIQGRAMSKISDLYIRYFTGGTTYEDGRHQIAVPTDEFTDSGEPKLLGVFRAATNTELLIDINLLIHIKPDNEADFDVVLNGLKRPQIYPSLGRHEDLVSIKHVSVVEYYETKTVALDKEMDAYVPASLLESSKKALTGANYILNKTYDVNQKTKFREWKKEKTVFLRAGKRIAVSQSGIYACKVNGQEEGIFFA